MLIPSLETTGAGSNPVNNKTLSFHLMRKEKLAIADPHPDTNTLSVSELIMQ